MSGQSTELGFRKRLTIQDGEMVTDGIAHGTKEGKKRKELVL